MYGIYMYIRFNQFTRRRFLKNAFSYLTIFAIVLALNESYNKLTPSRYCTYNLCDTQHTYIYALRYTLSFYIDILVREELRERDKV